MGVTLTLQCFRVFGAVATLSFVVAGPVQADFKVWTPDVNKGELAVEHVGDFGSDSNPDKSGEQSYTAEFEYGVTRWWQSELEFEFEREPGSGSGQATRFTQFTSENLFQFTERGEYWLDAGFFAEYGHGTLKGSVDEATFGPVLRKDFWGLSNSINLFVEKDLGARAAGRAQFLYAWETRIDAWVVTFGRRFAVEPGFQYYGQPGQFGHFARWGDQDNRAGPQLFGKIFNIGPGTLEWNAGVLFGLTAAVPAITPRWQLEYEIHF
jgi:hypothetical protein